MQYVDSIIWKLVFNVWPILAALVAGGWLRRRGDWGAGVVLWAWAAAASAYHVSDWYVNSVYRLQPGVTQGDWLPITQLGSVIRRLITASTLAILAALVLFRKANVQ